MLSEVLWKQFVFRIVMGGFALVDICGNLWNCYNGWVTDKVATKNISLLHTRLVTDEIINYFEVEKDSIDSVLDIFVRVCSHKTIAI